MCLWESVICEPQVGRSSIGTGSYQMAEFLTCGLLVLGNGLSGASCLAALGTGHGSDVAQPAENYAGPKM